MKKMFPFQRSDGAQQVEQEDKSAPTRLDIITDLCVSRLQRFLKAMGDRSAEHAATMFAGSAAAEPTTFGQSEAEPTDWRDRVNTDISQPVRVAKWMAAAFLALFVLWSVVVPLSGAVVASGTIAVEGRNFAIQHQIGGLVDAVLVTEGEEVSKGTPLVRLQDVTARADVEQLTKRLIALRARETSLVAERDNLPEPVFKEDDILLAQKHGVFDQVREQVSEFASRKARMQSEETILKERLVALDLELVGLQAAEESTSTQLNLIQGEVESKGVLVSKGLTAKSEFNSLKRAEADLKGRLGSNLAALGRVRSSMVEAREQLTRLNNQRRESASTGLNELRISISTIEEQLRSATDIFERKIVRAPADGIIIGLVANAVGSVLQPGQSVATLVPADTSMIVEARIQPNDVARIKVGDRATVRLSALSDRSTPEVEGEITYISADRLTDRATQLPYYLARVSFPELLPDGVEQSDLSPGLPVETFLGNEERSFIGYLLKPLNNSLMRAFRES